MALRALLFCCALSAAVCQAAGDPSWNPAAAASYLDNRAEWWAKWPSAARDHGTFCVSCHTAVPYALVRPALRTVLQEKGPSAPEQALTANVSQRVKLWADVEPFYKSSPDAPDRSTGSRGTEAVLNALILPDSADAWRNMWGMQIVDGPNRGAFAWLDFHNRPWEANDSQYYGTALAAVVVSRHSAADRDRPEVSALIDYLRREYAKQSLINQVVVLWASPGLPGLLTETEKAALKQELAKRQHEDGGWSLTDLAGDWSRRDKTPLETVSDGYATGLTAYALTCAKTSTSDPSLQHARQWLAGHQSAEDGRWLAYSMNKKRDLHSDVGRFMSDAATAYAV